MTARLEIDICPLSVLLEIDGTCSLFRKDVHNLNRNRCKKVEEVYVISIDMHAS